MKRIQYSTLALALTSVILSGCASTQSAHHTNWHNKQHPKEAVAHAVQSQLQSSFSYQTTVYVSNQHHYKAPTTKSPAAQSCEEIHDAAYVEMLKARRVQQPSSLDNSDMTAAAAADAAAAAAAWAAEQAGMELKIKNDYLACTSAYLGMNDYQSFDFQAFYQDNRHLDSQTLYKTLGESMSAHIANQAVTTESADADTTKVAQPTKLDAKKAELLHEYLFKPTKLTMQGNYQPLSGVFTALPSATYDAKNLHLSVNQPLYVDLKAGVLYLWADNFALANSRLVDKNLGEQWKNKWLAIALNDGSLPDDFAKDFIKAYLHAKKESFAVLEDASFVAVDAKAVLEMPYFSQNVDTDTKNLIAQSGQIIQSSPSSKAYAYSRYVFAETLLNEITGKYPLFFDTTADHHHAIVDGESRIYVDQANTVADEKTQQSNPTTTLNSKKFITLILTVLQNQVYDYYDNLAVGSDNHQANDHTPIWHYGMNHGRINWLHQRHYVVKPPVAAISPSFDEPVAIDTITIVRPRADHEFERLPKSVRTPDANNSVNLFDYGNELIERLQSGDDQYRQVMLQLLIGMGDDQSGAEDGIDGEFDFGDEPMNEDSPNSNDTP